MCGSTDVLKKNMESGPSASGFTSSPRHGAGGGHVVHERAYVAQELHHAAHAHVLGRAHAEHRQDGTVYETFAYAFAHLVLGEVSLFEIFVHQGLVILCGRLHQGVVQLVGPVHLLCRDFRNCGYAAVRPPLIFLHQQHVYHGVEARTALQGILHGHDF